MIILGIETSCDESAVSLLRIEDGSNPQIIHESISSQVRLHEAYGGVVPELASREHLKNLPLLYAQALEKTSITLKDIDCIAATQGPGLKGCLLMGLGFAKALSVASGKPFLGVNHIEGHILSPFLEHPITFPYLALVVSGGHTELVHVKDVGDYTILGRTIDDAAGEAFDKSANLLGFAYPGGALLAARADSHGASSYRLPRVMREAHGFSFSGLKTAVHQLIVREGGFAITEDKRSDLAAAIQEAIVDALLYKLKKAITDTGVRTIAVVGGVAANKKLQRDIAALPGITMYVPSTLHCTDNASMVAYAGAMRFMRGQKSDLNISAIARWPVEDISCV